MSIALVHCLSRGLLVGALLVSVAASAQTPAAVQPPASAAAPPHPNQREFDKSKFRNDVLRLPKGGLKSHQFTIEYAPPKDPKHTHLYDLLRQRKVLEKFQDFLAPIYLPNPVKLQTVGCDGVINAHFWQNAIQVCYEYFDWIFQNTPKVAKAGLSPHDAMIGPTVDVFLHETGHAILQLLDIPIFAREEDAADYIALIIMLEFSKEDARRLILGASIISGHDAKQEQEKNPALAALADMHSLPAVRYFNRWCMAYGMDPVLFADAIELGLLTPGRASHCKYEYSYNADAFKRLISPYLEPDFVQEVRSRKWFEFDTPFAQVEPHLKSTVKTAPPAPAKQ